MKKGDLVRLKRDKEWGTLADNHGLLWLVTGVGPGTNSYSIQTKSLATGFHFNWAPSELEVAGPDLT